MNQPLRFLQSKTSRSQPPLVNKQDQPQAARLQTMQSNVATTKQRVRPPATSPTHQPPLASAQLKAAVVPQNRTSPAAPPAYRPQPVPMVLQTKIPPGYPGRVQSRSNLQPPSAPLAYRPQPRKSVQSDKVTAKPKVVQPKLSTTQLQSTKIQARQSKERPGHLPTSTATKIVAGQTKASPEFRARQGAIQPMMGRFGGKAARGAPRGSGAPPMRTAPAPGPRSTGPAPLGARARTPATTSASLPPPRFHPPPGSGTASSFQSPFSREQMRGYSSTTPTSMPPPTTSAVPGSSTSPSVPSSSSEEHPATLMESNFNSFAKTHSYDFKTRVVPKDLARYLTVEEAFLSLRNDFATLFPGGAVWSEEMGGYKLTARTSIGWDGFPVSIVELGPSHMTLQTGKDHLLRGIAIHQIVLINGELYYRVEGRDNGMGGVGLIHAINNPLAYIMWTTIGSRIGKILRKRAQSKKDTGYSVESANKVPDDIA